SLVDSDIPHRTQIRDRIIRMWMEDCDRTNNSMASAVGNVSFTADLWSSETLQPFLAMTAHWISED
ncbi:hypothetical protein BJV78DRAFT_1100436, partial [Lactifluus subvellereus]